MTTLWELVADQLDPPPPPDPFEELGASLYPKQQMAEELCETTDETLFGGAVGGGKSFWLLLHAIVHCLRYQGAKALILRRDWPRLRRSIWSDSFVWLTGIATVDKAAHVWTFPNGSSIEFSGLDRDEDVHKYQGAAYSFIGWEELTEFTEYQYTYMLSRNRPPHGAPDNIRCHVASTTNPGGVGHSWVKRRFVRPPELHDDGERNIPEGVTVVPFEPWTPCPNEDQPAPLSRVFVPATLDDNEHLKKADPNYAARAAAGTSAGMRKALTSGDWDAIDAIEGTLWAQSSIDAHRVLPDESGRWLPAGAQLVRTTTMVDPAVTHGEDSDETGIVTAAKAAHYLAGKRTDHAYVLADDTPQRCAPDVWARHAVASAHKHGADEIGVEIDNGGELNVSVINAAQREMFAAGEVPKLLPIRPVRARSRGSKLARAKPVAQLYAQGRVHHVGHFARLEDQLTTWIPDVTPDSPDRLDAMVHAVLALGLAPTPLPAPKAEPRVRDAEGRRAARAKKAKTWGSGATW